MSDTYTATASTTIGAPPETVWDALTDPETIREYFFGSEVETDWAVGSPIHFRGEWEGETYEDRGEIQRFEPEHYHTVTWELSAVDAGTEVTLTQDNNDSEEARDHSEENWEMVLGGLRDLLEG